MEGGGSDVGGTKTGECLPHITAEGMDVPTTWRGLGSRYREQRQWEGCHAGMSSFDVTSVGVERVERTRTRGDTITANPTIGSAEQTQATPGQMLCYYCWDMDASVFQGTPAARDPLAKLSAGNWVIEDEACGGESRTALMRSPTK